MMMRGQRFSELNDAIKTAQEVANILECNVPIYYDAPYYYHWHGTELVEWVKPVIEDDEC